MAFSKKALRRLASSAVTSNSYGVSKYWFASNDAEAACLTAGYFNDARATLKVGDQIEGTVDLDGTPMRLLCMVATVPSAGNIIVTDLTV